MIKIGFEIHAELATKTKLFCSCPRTGDDNPNSRCCPVCLGHPGSKPSTNMKAVRYAVKLATALGCKISDRLVFSRKTYFYPDMSKNYQITQYEIPIGKGGTLELSNREINLRRVHIEEDPAALIHKENFVLVDYNRSGNPLVEIVTEPEIRNQKEAREFMKRLRTTLEYLEIFDKSCSIKADANVSIEGSGYRRVEVKNITGFKEIERAIEYEITRQRNVIRQGKNVNIETRGWDSESGITFSMRSKESEEDYGYIMEPDLVPVPLKFNVEIPELANEKYKRFVEQGMEKTTARVLSQDRGLAGLYEKVSKEVGQDTAANWIRRDVQRALKLYSRELADSYITPESLISLLKLVEANRITSKTAGEILEILVEKQVNIDKYIGEEGLFTAGEEKVKEACQSVVNELPDVVSAYRKGNKKAFNRLLGEVMKKTGGKAKPEQATRILKKYI